jgi:hypothetical protein
MRPGPREGKRTHTAIRLALMLISAPGLSGCLVAGYSSGSGLWVWPGSIVITLVLILLYFLTRHR